MKTLSSIQMEAFTGGVACEQAAGWLFGAGLVMSFVPGLTPLGITLLLSSTTGALCGRH